MHAIRGGGGGERESEREKLDDAELAVCGDVCFYILFFPKLFLK
jgi:hypothetical protein